MIIAQRPVAYNKPYVERLAFMARRAALFMSSDNAHKGWGLV